MAVRITTDGSIRVTTDAADIRITTDPNAEIYQTLPGFTQELDATETILATIDQTLQGFAQELDATEIISATIDQTLQGFTQELDAIEITAATAIIDQTLQGFTQELDASEIIPATIEQTLQGFAQELDAIEIIPATITQTLRGLAQELDAIEIIPVTIYQTLKGFAPHLSGDISQTLFGFDQRIRVHTHHRGHPVRDGLSGINEPRMTRDPPIHPAELELFRARAYGRGVDGLVPPEVVARANLTTRHFPHSRPVVDRRPRGK